jgi:hypothetical protein
MKTVELKMIDYKRILKFNSITDEACIAGNSVIIRIALYIIIG